MELWLNNSPSLRARASVRSNLNRIISGCFSRTFFAMTRSICMVLFLSSMFFALKGQEVQKIKIKKEKSFLKAEFDNTQYKVVAIDKYGNPHEEVIKSFVVSYKEEDTVYEAPVMGNTFPDKTINFLTKKKKTATKICLKKIKAEDSEGHLEDLPDLCDIVIFPDCKNCKIKKGN
jgi:hypothetical protein